MTISTMSPKGRNKFISILLPLLFWVGLWALAALAVGKPFLLPSPLLTAETLLAQAVLPAFWQKTGLTLLRMTGGYLLGALLGAVCGVLTHFSTIVSALLSPMMRLLRATPVASFILLLLLWVGTTWVPVVAAAMMVIPIIWGNVEKGLESTDAQLLELTAAYQFTAAKKLRLLYLPSVLPFLFAAAKTSIGLAWKAGVAAEVLCVPKFAIGTEIYRSKLYLETPALFAWTAVVILFSFLIEKLIGAALSRWEVPS